MSTLSDKYLCEVQLSSNDTMGLGDSDDEVENYFLNEVMISNFVMRLKRISQNTSRLPGNS